MVRVSRFRLRRGELDLTLITAPGIFPASRLELLEIGGVGVELAIEYEPNKSEADEGVLLWCVDIIEAASGTSR